MILKQENRTRIILAGILVLVILFACLGALGYFGVKTIRRTSLRVEARKAFASEDWKNAEKLLNKYITQDPDSEDDIVRLARVYRHFGNTGEEMLCWYRAASLNPLKPEYQDAYTACAMSARDFPHLFTYMSRRVHLGETLSPKDKILYLISAVMTNHGKNVETYYENMLKTNPEAFRQDELGRYAEFLVKNKKLTQDERSSFIEQGLQSDDPFIRLESILFYLGWLEDSGQDSDYVDEKMETMLKQAADLNRFAGSPYLAKFYFSRYKFSSVIEVLEPFLADIAHIPMSVLYAESCVYGTQPEKLKPLADRYRLLGPKHQLLASYFDALSIFSRGEGKNDDLTRLMREINGVVQTPLANLVNLQVALNSDSAEKVGSSFESIMRNHPFYNVQERARSAVYLYLWNRIQEEPGLAGDPRMVKLAQLISNPDQKDVFLTRIMISDMFRRKVLTRQDIQDALNAFPFDPYLLQVAAEFELFNGNPGQCLDYIDRFRGLENADRSAAFDLLHMLALELAGRIDDAAKEYTALVDSNETNMGILYRYFDFCVKYKRRAELSRMADRLEASSVPELKALAPFFRAEELFQQEKTEEALSLLETAVTDNQDFMFYAANTFSSHGRGDQALSRYLALSDNSPDRDLILANIAEVYLAKGMKEKALSYAEKSWQTNQDDELTQFVYAQMLAANGRYQDAEKVLTIPNRKVELPDNLRGLWTDIMIHCVREDLEKQTFSRALERVNHYLILYPDDTTFLDLKARAERELRKTQDVRK